MSETDQRKKEKELELCLPTNTEDVETSALSEVPINEYTPSGSVQERGTGVTEVCEQNLEVLVKKERAMPILLLCTFVAAFPGIADGFASSVVNNSKPAVFEWFQEKGMPLTTSAWAIALSLHPLGGLVGSAIAAPLIRKYGPHKTQVINNIIYLLSSLVFMFVQNAAMLYVARFFAGVSIGIGNPAKMVYIGEIAPTHLRGPLIVLAGAIFYVGLVLGLVLGMQSTMGTPELWRYLYGLTIMAPAVHFPFSFFMPESPRYLFNCGRVEEAQRHLNRLRGHQGNEKELEDYRRAKERESAANMSFMSGLRQLFTSRTLARPLSIVLVIPFLAPFASCWFVAFYGNQTFVEAGLNNAELASVMGGVMSLVSSTIMYPVLERFGRKTLMLFGWVGSGITAALFVVAAVNSHNSAWNKASVVILLLTQFFGSISFGVQMVIAPELFPTSVRGIGVSIAQIMNRVSQFIMLFAFPFISSGLGDYSFLIGTGAAVFTCFFVFFVVPETTGMSMEEIQDKLQKDGAKQSS